MSGPLDAPVKVENLSFAYGETHALTNLSFEVSAGTMFALVGPDGAGKTTIIRILCGILHPKSGRASIYGYDTVKGKAKIHARIGYLSQRFTLYGDLSINENIEFFARIHGIRRFQNKRAELLELMGLAQFGNRLASRLSGGMKQKLALACTLIHTPELLLLDEPTTGVDPVSRREFWMLLSGLMHKGMTIVMSTPYLDEAERTHRIGLLNEGTLLAEGSPQNIRSTIDTRIFQIKCDDVRRAAKLIARELGNKGDVQLFGDRIDFVTPSETSIDKEIRSLLRNESIAIHSLESMPVSLENAFITLITQSRKDKAADVKTNSTGDLLAHKKTGHHAG